MDITITVSIPEILPQPDSYNPATVKEDRAKEDSAKLFRGSQVFDLVDVFERSNAPSMIGTDYVSTTITIAGKSYVLSISKKNWPQ